MNISDQESPPNYPKFELGPGATEVIRLFQEFKLAEDEKERLTRLEDFRTKLVELLAVAGESNRDAREQNIPKALLDDESNPTGDVVLFIGGGTSGQRIFFKSNIDVYDRNKAEKLVGEVDALRKNLKDHIALESMDGKLRWMRYPMPEGSDKKFGQKYWVKFMENFGDDTVDLLQDLQKSNEKR